ncbi:MAG: hypothetical protein V4733_02265 [Verrucomicrobiota bacterium]
MSGKISATRVRARTKNSNGRRTGNQPEAVRTSVRFTAVVAVPCAERGVLKKIFDRNEDHRANRSAKSRTWPAAGRRTGNQPEAVRTSAAESATAAVPCVRMPPLKKICGPDSAATPAGAAAGRTMPEAGTGGMNHIAVVWMVGNSVRKC